MVAGCGDPPRRTAVVVVIESDLDIPGDVDAYSFTFAPGADAPVPGTKPGGFSAAATLSSFPVAAQFTGYDMTPSFSVMVQLTHGLLGPTSVPPTIAVGRTVTNIRFEDQRTMMLVLPMLRACTCQGTSCPAVGTPDCDNLDQPALQPFDRALTASIDLQLAVSQTAFVPH
jgi:hypothetical protein